MWFKKRLDTWHPSPLTILDNEFQSHPFPNIYYDHSKTSVPSCCELPVLIQIQVLMVWNMGMWDVNSLRNPSYSQLKSQLLVTITSHHLLCSQQDIEPAQLLWIACIDSNSGTHVVKHVDMKPKSTHLQWHKNQLLLLVCRQWIPISSFSHHLLWS